MLKAVQRTATSAWSPNEQLPVMLAAGTVAGAVDGSFSSDGRLELFELGLGNAGTDMVPVGSVVTPARFHKLAWAALAMDSETTPNGVLAGGMDTGAVTIWNPAAMIEGGDASAALIATAEKHNGPVRALDFNPFQANLLASGASESEIYIWDLASPTEPTVYAPGSKGSGQGENISAVAWNRKVQHIMASTSFDGASVVWDLKVQKPVIRFSDSQNAQKNRCINWCPDQATMLCTVSENDQSPVVQIWDLRNAMAPVRELKGHTSGILSADWCQRDADLLLTCGKDNRTLVWNPNTGDLVSEFPAATNWLFQVDWCPRIPGMISTCSFDGYIRVSSLQNATAVAPSGGDAFGQAGTAPASAGGVKEAPRWLKRPAGASFGFGGKLVSFSEASGSNVTLRSVITEAEVVEKADHLEADMASGNLASYCAERVAEAHDEEDATVWSLLGVLMADAPRKALLAYLGFDKEAVEAVLASFADRSWLGASGTAAAPPAAVASPPPAMGADDGSSFFSNPDALGAATASTASDIALGGAITIVAGDDSFSAMLSKAVMVGDWEGATSVCIGANRPADALLVAAAGGPELYAKARDWYLASQAGSEPAMGLVGAVVKKDIAGLVARGDLGSWREVLTVVSTYARAKEYPDLCNTLGDRLAASGQATPALVCYLCACNTEKTLDVWLARPSASIDELQSTVATAVVFREAVGGAAADSPAFAAKIAEYAAILTAQGKTQTALKFLDLIGGEADEATQEAVNALQFQIYYSGSVNVAGRTAPAYPFAAPARPVVFADNSAVVASPASATPAASNPFAGASANTGSLFGGSGAATTSASGPFSYNAAGGAAAGSSPAAAPVATPAAVPARPVATAIPTNTGGFNYTPPTAGGESSTTAASAAPVNAFVPPTAGTGAKAVTGSTAPVFNYTPSVRKNSNASAASTTAQATPAPPGPGATTTAAATSGGAGANPYAQYEPSKPAWSNTAPNGVSIFTPGGGGAGVNAGVSTPTGAAAPPVAAAAATTTAPAAARYAQTGPTPNIPTTRPDPSVTGHYGDAPSYPTPTFSYVKPAAEPSAPKPVHIAQARPVAPPSASNTAAAAAQAAAAATAAAAAAQAAAPAKKQKSKPGDISKVPEQYKPMCNFLFQVIDHHKNNAPPALKRQVAKAEGQVLVFMQELNDAEVADNMAQGVMAICQAINNNDLDAAMALQAQMITAEYHEWLVGFKNLLQVLKKSA